MDRQTPPLDRRRVLKIAGGAALALLVPARPVAAGRQWCRVDPVFRFTDAGDPLRTVTTNVNVLTEVGAEVDSTGPIELVVTVPEGIETELLSQDEGLGHGYDIAVESDTRGGRSRRHVKIAVAARVPATGRHRIRLEFVPDSIVEDADAAQGWTNDWIVVRTRLRFPTA
jgi:hypothetical protein